MPAGTLIGNMRDVVAKASGLTLPQHTHVEVEDGSGVAPVIKIAKNATMLCTTNASHKKPRSRRGVSPAATSQPKPAAELRIQLPVTLTGADPH
jgi:hypothetical protein